MNLEYEIHNKSSQNNIEYLFVATKVRARLD